MTYETGGRSVRAVDGVSLEVNAGEIVGLVGESGCGKSTLARATVGLLPSASGSVTFRGHVVTPLSRRARPRELLGLQMVFQNPYSSLNPRRTVGAQLAEAVTAATGRRTAERRQLNELLELVALPAAAAERYPHEFSGGQRQRIAVARVLAAKPSIVVLDEPLSSLDASAQAQLANLLVELARTLEIGLLLISHDLAIVRYVADRVNVMYLGRVVETGSSERVWEQPAHPYTEALIGAVPHADGMGLLPEPLPGEVPDPAAPPPGCRFHPRCPYAFERCPTDDPPLLRLIGGQAAACWLHSDSPGESAKRNATAAPAQTVAIPLARLAPRHRSIAEEQEETL